MASVFRRLPTGGSLWSCKSNSFKGSSCLFRGTSTSIFVPKTPYINGKSSSIVRGNSPFSTSSFLSSSVSSESPSASPASLLLKVGLIEKVDLHPDADSLYVSQVSLGDGSPTRTVCSGLVGKVTQEQMLNRPVVLVCNLKPAKLRGVLSEAMMLAAEKDDLVELIHPPFDSQPGQLLQFDGYTDPAPDRIKPKVWEAIQPRLFVNSLGIVVYKDETGSEHRLIVQDALDKSSPTTADVLTDARVR